MPGHLSIATLISLGVGLCATILIPPPKAPEKNLIAGADAAPQELGRSEFLTEPPRADGRGNHGPWYERIQTRCRQDSILAKVQESRRQQQRLLRLLPEERAAMRKIRELEHETARLSGHSRVERFDPILERERWPELWCAPDRVAEQVPVNATGRRTDARTRVLRARMRLLHAKVEHRRRRP